MLCLIPKKQYFHVLRGNNLVVDDLANLGATLPKGELVLQGHTQRPLSPNAKHE